MTYPYESWLNSLGFLRLALLLLALLNMLLPIINAQLAPLSAVSGERSVWEIFASLIAPIMAPLLVVVILFDYIMSRVRAADSSGALRARYLAIGRIELIVIAITLAYWIPFFVSLTR